MTSNDFGHRKNLGKDEENLLKQFWILLIEKVDEDNRSKNEKENRFQENLFRTIGFEHPDGILLRYLRARKWILNDSFEQLIDTIEWRSRIHLDRLMFNGESTIEVNELRQGKTFYIGFDHFHRPINYIGVRFHLKGEFSSESTENLTILTMEIGRQLLRDPIETVTVLIDLTDFSLKNMDFQHVKFIINVLQNYYPESLGLALIVNSPWLFNSCWNIIKSWLDPIVQQKIRFIRNVDELKEFIPSNLLPKHLNGTNQRFEYIGPSRDEINQMETIRNNSTEEKIRRDFHLKCQNEYLDLTRQWTRNSSASIDEQRNRSIEQLKSSFEQWIPFIQTKTFYHRIGLIDDQQYRRIIDQQNKCEHF